MSVPTAIAQHLRASAHTSPDHPALVWSGGGLSYAELDHEVDRLAAGLAKLGIRKGDRVVFAVGNTPAFAVIHFGILRVGAVSVPLNPGLKASELRPFIAAVTPRAIIAEESAVNDVMSAGPHAAPVFVIGKHSTARPYEQLLAEPPVEEPEIEAEDLAVLACTSGTSGTPKVTRLTYGNLTSNLEQMLEIPQARTEKGDVVLGVLPLFHIFGMNVVLGLSFLQSATVAIERRFDPAGTARRIDEAGVTAVVGAPPMYISWVASPDVDATAFSKVRFAISGASPLPPEVIPAFKERFGVEVWEGYGLTETSPTLTSTRMADQRPGSVGKPVPGVELKVVDETGDDVQPGDPGEVWVRGPNVFSGYWNDEAASADAFAGDWFRTGDVGYLDTDGYLWLVDRKKELIIVSGFNVYPREVENALRTHPAVLDTAVVGEPHPRQGESIKAFVVLRPGHNAGEEDLIVHCTRSLARFKVPSEVVFVDSLPRLVSGKVLKRMLRPEELGPSL